jgi:hypothetical protein
MEISDWAKNLVERKKKALEEKRAKDDKLDASTRQKVDRSVSGRTKSH